jgi:hypothetical protein
MQGTLGQAVGQLCEEDHLRPNTFRMRPFARINPPSAFRKTGNSAPHSAARLRHRLAAASSPRGVAVRPPRRRDGVRRGTTTPSPDPCSREKVTVLPNSCSPDPRDPTGEEYPLALGRIRQDNWRAIDTATGAGPQSGHLCAAACFCFRWIACCVALLSSPCRRVARLGSAFIQSQRDFVGNYRVGFCFP